MSNLTAPERETTIAVSDADDVVRIWTARRKDITRLRRNESFTEIASGYDGTTEWAQFTIPTDQWNPASGAKRRRKPLTEEQRQALADRLAKARAAQA